MQLETVDGNHRNNSIPQPSSFLFINGDANSTSFSRIEEKELRPVINRHVQRWAFETKRRKKLTSLAYSGKRLHGQEIELSLPRTEASDDQGLDKAQFDVVRLEVVTSKFGEDDSAVEKPKLKACIRSAGNYLDPFASTDIQVDGGVYRMLQYYTYTWKPFTCSCDVRTQLCMFPSEVEASLANEHVCDNVNEIIRNCLNNKTHMYALLA